MKILFVEPPRDISNALRTRRWSNLSPAGAPPAEFASRLRLYRPLKWLPNGHPTCRRVNERLTRSAVASEMRAMGMKNPVLWVNAHYAGHLAGHLGESKVIYDITDDWTEMKQCAQGAALTKHQDAALCEVADDIIVCSERLAELKRSPGRAVHLIPNGVDADHYSAVLDGTGPLPAECGTWAHPIYGYTGTLHSDRLDLDLIESVAQRLQQASFVFLGPNFLSESETARLLACGNVFLPGSVPYARIPQFMRAFDACIVPHRVSPFTESLNPIKLWEYLAAGKPIVSTPVAGFRDFPELVALAEDPDQFVAALHSALGEPAELATERQKAVVPHSWEQRIGDVEKILSTSSGRSLQSPALSPVGAAQR